MTPGTFSLLCFVALATATPCPGQSLPIERKDPSRPPVVIKVPSAPRFGALVVVTELAGAEIRLYTVDRKRKPALKASGTSDETGSYTFGSLGPGRYRVVARAPEHREVSGEVTVAAGTTPATLSVRPVPTFGHLLLTAPAWPEDARILVDDVEVPPAGLLRDSPTAVRVKTAPGAHSLRVERPGDRPFETRVGVAAGEESAIAVVLEPLRASLLVRSRAGARAYLDGEMRGTVPSTGELLLGDLSPEREYTLRLELADHAPLTKTVRPTVDAARVVETALEPLPTSGPFEDAFVSGLSLWNAPSTWTVPEDKTVLTVRGDPSPGFPKDLRYRDCEVFFNLQLTDPRGAAWVVRARDASNGYVCYLAGPGSKWPDQFRSYVLRDGKVDLANPASAQRLTRPLTPSTFYRVRIRIEGNVVQHWITPFTTGTEVSVGLFQDRANTFPMGNVGFLALDGTSFVVEGFVIRPIEPRAPRASE